MNIHLGTTQTIYGNNPKNLKHRIYIYRYAVTIAWRRCYKIGSRVVSKYL